MPHHVQNLDILVVSHHNFDKKKIRLHCQYVPHFGFLRIQTRNIPLLYGCPHLPHCNSHIVASPTNVFPLLHHSNPTNPSTNHPSLDVYPDHLHCTEPNALETSSFVASVPNTHTKLHKLQRYLHPPNYRFENAIEWPPIRFSPIN